MSRRGPQGGGKLPPEISQAFSSLAVQVAALTLAVQRAAVVMDQAVAALENLHTEQD